MVHYRPLLDEFFPDVDVSHPLFHCEYCQLKLCLHLLTLVSFETSMTVWNTKIGFLKKVLTAFVSSQRNSVSRACQASPKDKNITKDIINIAYATDELYFKSSKAILYYYGKYKPKFESLFTAKSSSVAF